MGHRLKGMSYAIFSSITFGFIPLFAKNAMAEGMTSDSIIFYRFALATLVLGLLMLLRGHSFKIERTYLMPLLVFGGGCYGGTAFFLLLSYQYVASGVATTIHFLYPVAVALLMRLLFAEHLSKKMIAAMFLSLTGAILLTSDLNASELTFGALLAAVSVITYAIYIVGLKQSALKNIHVTTLTFYVLLFSSLVVFAVAWSRVGAIERISSVSMASNLLGLAILSTIISNFTLIAAVKLIGPTPTSILGTLEPLTAIVVGIFFFHESLSFIAMIGAALIIVSVVVMVWRGVAKIQK